jgi:hypothetical protein
MCVFVLCHIYDVIYHILILIGKYLVAVTDGCFAFLIEIDENVPPLSGMNYSSV